MKKDDNFYESQNISSSQPVTTNEYNIINLNKSIQYHNIPNNQIIDKNFKIFK